MKFKTSDNLIDLLVGQSLYSSPDVAMRELLQNAEDACHLQALDDHSHVPEILVRVSVLENWVEVCDNGLGMDQMTFEDSFATIGASKSNSPKLQALLARANAGDRPIGQFGIGVLSCFGVADIVEVRSLAEGESPVSMRIQDRRADFEYLTDHRSTRGTTLRLHLKSDGPLQGQQVKESLSRYVRHAHHIFFEDVDSGERTTVPEQWLLDSWQPESKVISQAIESGHLQLSSAWDSIEQGLDIQLVICNAGFLVSNSITDILPEFALGVRGEINVRPGFLTILMDREGFKQDQRWEHLAKDLIQHYQSLVTQKLDSWLAIDLSIAQYDKLRAIQRIVLLILKTPMGEVVGRDNIALAQKLLPSVLLLAEGKSLSFSSLIDAARKQPPLYVHKTDDQQLIQRSFSDRGQNYSLTETVRSLDLRVSLLKLNGFAVARVERHDYTVQIGNKSQRLKLHDYEALVDTCNDLGIQVSRVQDAPNEHTTIGSSPDAEAIATFFEMSSELKIQSVDTMTDAIIADFNGYILNVRSKEIRSILEIMPAAVGNPVRRELLAAYLAMSTYNITAAREIIFSLLVDPEFESKSTQTTGRYFRAYLDERVRALLRKQEDQNA